MAGIAAKSPLAVTGTKAVLLRGRDLTVDQGLDYVATWNSGMLLSGDLAEAVSAQIQKRKPVFAKLWWCPHRLQFSSYHPFPRSALTGKQVLCGHKVEFVTINKLHLFVQFL